MAFNEELAIRQLIAMYRAGFQDIIEILIDKDARGLSTRHQRALLGNVHQILFAMDTEADLWIQDVVGKVYSSTTSDIITTLVDMGYPKPTDSFSRVHQRAVDVIGQNMSGNLKNATQYVGRRVDDVFRQVGLEQTGKKLVTGASWQEMKSNLVEDMLSKGQTGFVDKLGREWRLDSYAEMVARTTTREAASTATINQCIKSGCDLVQVSTHYPTCHLRVPIQGKVYSLSGTDKRYPAYGEETRIPVHPNCRHVLTPYNRELDLNAEKVEKHSNTSLTEDTRTEQEKAAYKDTQDQARIANNKRNARETLYTPSAPEEDKIKAAKRLDGIYKRTGGRPTPRDAKLMKPYIDANAKK